MAQTSADYWYFGNKAAINFNGGTVSAVLDSEMQSVEGCATWSDQFGNLLFYSKGDTIWDASHNVMQNGSGLLGNGIGGPASQSAMVIPRPNSSTDFYLFTIQSFNGGVAYSRIDMTLNGGLGGVVSTEKNIPLVDDTPEVMTAVRHPNNLDYWFVTLRKPGDEAYAFSVTSAGVNTTPVISNTGLSLDQDDVVGYLKGSQQSDQLALVLWRAQLIQPNADVLHLFDFDNAVGQVTYDLAITPSQADSFNYGVEFSPNGDFLYAQSYNVPDLRQYDLTAGSAAAISASEELVGLGYSGSAGGALQLGPDGQIYVARNANDRLAAVTFPDQPGSLCGYNHDAVDLNGRQCAFGLPQFPPFLLDGEVAVLEENCINDSVYFFSTYPNADSLLWLFGDPGSGSEDTSKLANPAHLFSDSGTFTVTLIAFDAFLSDTTMLEIHILPNQTVDLGPDTTYCTQVDAVFDVDQPYATFLWNDGSTDSIVTVDVDTTLSVTVLGTCDTVSDTVTIRYSSGFAFSLGPDSNLCRGQDYELDPEVTVDDVIYSWSNGSNQDSIIVNQSDTYRITATNDCSTIIDSVVLRFDPVPTVTLPDDTINCENAPVFVERPLNDSLTYTWSDSSSATRLRVDSTALIWLAAENQCGFAIDSMNINNVGRIDISLGVDTQLCPDDTILLRATWPGASYLWSTGETVDSIWTNTVDDIYSVTVTVDSCVQSDRIDIQFTEVACPDIDCRVRFDNVFTPNGDGWNDLFRLRSDCEILKYDLRIYSRWGQLVHQSSQINYGWDGFIAGEPAPEGVYYFILEYRDEVVVDADRRVQQASFTLLR